MAKFCGNCGNRLNGGEPFCPQCGYRIEENAVQPTAAAGAPQYAPAPAPQPAAQTPAYPPAAPQPAPAPVPAPQPIPAPVPVPQPQPIQPQGAPPPAAPPQAAPAKQIPSYADFSRSAGQTDPKQNQPGKKRGCGSCLLNVMLSLLIIVQLTIAAFWHPGFMVSGPKPENSDPRRIASENKPTAASSKTDRYFRYAGSVSAIKARYSEDVIKNAPKSEAAVSPKNSQAECGGVKAEFRSWNLQGDDAFIVRALPELTDKEAGYTVKGYDFSMASGQNEFATDVTLTIPRTAKGENEGFCVAFNEAAGQWERVYSEISADGKSYTIYTDHFCPKGEALPTNELTKSIANGVASKELENKQLRDYFGIFYYNQSDLSHQKNDSGQWERPGCTQMTVPVFADYACLWYFFTEKYAYSLDDIAKAIGRNPKDKVIYADPNPALTFGCEAVDLTAAASDLTGITPDHPLFKGPSAVTTLISWIGTASKIKSEIRQGKKFNDSAWNNKLSLLSSSVVTLGLFVSNPPVASGLTIAGVAIYGVSKIYQAASVRELLPLPARRSLRD